jgi:chlorophyll synthase
MSGLDLSLDNRGLATRLPSMSAVLELLKPVTWFAPVWAFMCGVVSAGVSLRVHWLQALAGMILAGPAICAASQAVNDWFDRHVDVINEPNRPIPSGRIPGRWGLWIAIFWSGLSVALAASLGPWVLGAAVVGLGLAWAYSAPPLRLKQAGWWGPASVALCYEGMAWFTGAAAVKGAFPDPRVVVIAALYSLGAIGIMILNDFKAVEGDRRMNIRSVPVDLGIENAAWLACFVMAAPQVVVAALLVSWGRPLFAGAIVLSLVIQCVLMRRLLGEPRRFAPWYNATGTSLYVLGMLAAGFALGLHTGVAR